MAKTAVITGATSGIGEALAFELGRRGYRLGLTGRRVAKLEAVKSRIESRFADMRVEVRTLDVRNYEDVSTVLNDLAEALGGIDVVIANAGVSKSRSVGSEGFSNDQETVETNLLGAMATVDASVALMKPQGWGQIVGISSVAAFRGLPGSAAYSASKAGFSAYLEAVRGEVCGDGIRVTTISPGFVDTPLNKKMKSRPFVISPKNGARLIVDRIEDESLHATIPAWPWSIVGFVMRNAPDSLWSKVASRRARRRSR